MPVIRRARCLFAGGVWGGVRCLLRGSSDVGGLCTDTEKISPPPLPHARSPNLPVSTLAQAQTPSSCKKPKPARVNPSPSLPESTLDYPTHTPSPHASLASLRLAPAGK